MNFKTKEILKYLAKNVNKEIPIDKIKNKFKLCHMDFVKLVRPLYNKDLITITDTYIKVTKYAKYYLDDLKIQKRNLILDKIIWSFIIPLIVSIIGTLLTLLLTK